MPNPDDSDALASLGNRGEAIDIHPAELLQALSNAVGKGELKPRKMLVIMFEEDDEGEGCAVFCAGTARLESLGLLELGRNTLLMEYNSDDEPRQSWQG